jgi:tRNA (Thr-GGU) A37 N-methylase
VSCPVIQLSPIGVIHSGHIVPEKTPIQPVYAGSCTGTVEVLPEYADGLDDLDGTSLLYIKPYVSRFVCIQTGHNGRQDEVSEVDAQQRGKRNF